MVLHGDRFGNLTEDNTTVHLGVVKKERNFESLNITRFSDFKTKIELTGFIYLMNKLACKYEMDLESFNYTKRNEQVIMKFVPGKQIYRFQYVITCFKNGIGLLRINFDKFLDFIFDRKTRIGMECKIPSYKELDVGNAETFCVNNG